MLPMNLLAPDSAHFDAGLKAGQGVQPPENGFSVAFGTLMQAPETGAGPLATFPPGSDAQASWPAAGGEILPQDGNHLPPEGAVALPEIQPIAGEIPDDSPALDVLAPATMELPVARVQVTPAASESRAPAFKAAGAPTTGELPAPAVATPVASLPGASVETRGRPDTAHPGLLQHIRYLKPGTDAQTRVAADAGPALALQRPDAPLTSQPPSTMPQATTGMQEFAAQVTDATRMSNALIPAGTESLLPADVQDLKAAQPLASPLPSIATIKTSPAATAAPSPAASTQWSGSSIDVAPGQPGWNEALGDRVTWMAGNRIQNAELRLNPAELGPLRVQISMDDGNASVTFTAQHPLTRDAIEQALPRLREMLADQGLSLQNASVSDDGPRHQQAGAGGKDAAPQFVSAQATNGNGMTDGENPSPLMRAPSGLVDVFA